VSGFKVKPQITGPALFAPPNIVCFLQQEASQFLFLLESGGFLQLESCAQPPPGSLFLLLQEDGVSTFTLENGAGSLELEAGP
jgi:hypothetical protein